MKTALMVTNGNGKYLNLGDFIQTLAAKKYFDRANKKVDLFIERDELSLIRGDEKIQIILNGWFMSHPENWPPSDILFPLLISFHISPSVADTMLSRESILFLKKNSGEKGIGCRDIGTLKLMEKKSIPAYFSGCLTLTLGISYKTKIKNNKIYFVDSYCTGFVDGKGKKSYLLALRSLIYYITHKTFVNLVNSKYQYYYTKKNSKSRRNRIKRVLKVSDFCKSYTKIFDKEILIQAEYLTHSIPKTYRTTNESSLEMAEYYIKLYASAGLVVTSRIHCALPCLGLETPVLFVNSDALSKNNSFRSPGRFNGLIDLMNCLYYKKSKVKFCFNAFGIKKINLNNFTLLKNPHTYKEYCMRLDESVSNFVNKSL